MNIAQETLTNVADDQTHLKKLERVSVGLGLLKWWVTRLEKDPPLCEINKSTSVPVKSKN